jgi:3-oxoacyl-[acyl-carrier protein] reductase
MSPNRFELNTNSRKEKEQNVNSNNSGKLNGKVAVVTGASKGIGAAIAASLAAEGAAVVVNYASSKAGADRVVSAITGAGGKAIAVQADVSKHADIGKLFSETRRAFGHVDILVNNAGVYEFAALETVTEEHFHRQFNVNVLGLLQTTQEAVKLFPATGGSIVNISSVVSVSPMPNASVYSATKAAVDAITKSLAKELGPKKIRVNSLNPGMIDTEGARTLGVIDGDLQKQVVAQTPLGRIGQPVEIAKVAVFLASEDSGWVTGETLMVSGGMK